MPGSVRTCRARLQLMIRCGSAASALSGTDTRWFRSTRIAPFPGANRVPGILSLMADAAKGKFDLVYAEALDRMSRDQEDVAGVYKRLRFADVRIITLAEGEISELHVGLKGTMNALFLTDLANKTRRGLRGRVEAGRSGGGVTYGYDVLRSQRADGTLEAGDRRINEAEAEIIRRVFREYTAGRSPRTIAL